MLCSRANERLAYYLLEEGKGEAAMAAARAGIDALPEDPPRWERARAMATYAQSLLTADDLSPAQEWALRARDAARAAGAPWVEADALVTLGLLDERAGRPAAAIEVFILAHRQARDAGVLGVRLRAAFQLARMHLESGDLAQASATAHEGLKRAEEAGLLLAPYGLDLQYLHYLAHYNDGDWDHAQHVADGFPVRVATDREAVLSAMALFIDVARGTPGSPTGVPGWSSSGPARSSANTWPAACSPSTRSGRATRPPRWPRWRQASRFRSSGSAATGRR